MKNKKHFLRHQQDICELLKNIAKGRRDQVIEFFLTPSTNFVKTLVSSSQKLANICKNRGFGSCWELLHRQLMSKQTHVKFL